MRLPRFRLAAPLVFFLGLFVHYAHSSHSSTNSISFLTKIPLVLAFLAKDISGARVWVPNVPVGIASMEERDGSIKDEYYEISNAFAKPGSKIVQEEEVISDQPYPWISLDEEWRLAHLQSPYVLRKKKGSSKKSASSKKSSSSDELDDIETEDGEEQSATSSSDEVEDEEVPIASSGEAEEEEEFEQVPDEDNEEEQDDVVPREYLNNEESVDYSASSTGPPIPLPPPQNDESEENAADSEEEDEESEDDDNSSSASKVPLQALSHTGVEEEDDSTETNLELIPDEVKEAIVREMAKQYAKQARISATQIKKKVTTSKPTHIYSVKEHNQPEVFRVTDPRLTKSQPVVHHDSPATRVTNSDGPFTEHGGGGKGKGKKKGKGKGKGQGHGWGPPPKIWHPPPQQYHEPHKHVRDGLLEQWTKGSQWERIIHSYHDYKDKQHYEQKHGKDPHGGPGPLHKKPGIGESLFKGSFWERAFVTYANYKKKQQNKGAHEMAGEGWAPYDR